MVDYPRIRVNKQTPTPRIRLRVLPATLPLNVSMQATATEIQWRVGDGPWQDLIPLSAFVAGVTSVSVVSANGLAGTVANPTTTPALTLSTTVTGIIKGDGTSFSAATAGTDFSLGTSALATGILKSTTATGALSIATGADLPAMTATVGGAVPTPPNNTTTYLRGDGTFATPAGAGTVTHTAGALTANAVALGNGAADLTVLASLGTTTTVLHGNAAGAPTFGAVAIGTDVSGLGTGIAAALAVNVGSAGAPVVNGGALGTPSSGTLTNATGLPVSTGISGLAAGIATWLVTPSSANLRAALTDESGTGPAYFQGGDIGTPSAGVLTNATGLPISTGVSGLAAGVATFLATPNSANLAAAMTDETGSGANVFANTPTLVTPVLGAATATSINKMAITAPATSSTLAVADGKTATISNSLTFTGTDGTSFAFPSTSDTVVTLAATQTETNKRITPRIGTIASSATPTPASDSNDEFTVTALAAAATFAAPTGTPTDGQKLILRIKDNGTARALAWNAIYRIVGTVLPTTTVISKLIYIGLIYNSADTKWDVVAVNQEA